MYGDCSLVAAVLADDCDDDDDADDDDDCNTDDNASRYQSAVSASKHPRHRRCYTVIQVQSVLSVDTWTIRLYRQVTRQPYMSRTQLSAVWAAVLPSSSSVRPSVCMSILLSVCLSVTKRTQRLLGWPTIAKKET